MKIRPKVRLHRIRQVIMMHDVVIVGAGPAGLTVAIESARRGLAVAVLERGHLPIDKACGEGIMPAGCAVLSPVGSTRSS